MATAKCTTSVRAEIAPISSQSSGVSESRQLKIRDFRPSRRLLEGNEPPEPLRVARAEFGEQVTRGFERGD
jgi:hypothetical protein